MSVRTRFAPSPTGYLHVGGARTALFNFLFARHHGGTFVLRVEDTDEARNTAAARDAIFTGLRWLGLDWDEGPEAGGQHGPYFQSERQAIYDTWFEVLRSRGRVYEDGGAWRFRFERKPVIMHDLVCGEVTINYADESNTPDMVIKRSDGSYVFHFVNVVDDLEMKITHVIRGEDHLMNTPKHLQLFEALGATPPLYAHIPLILNVDGSKMSKRDAGAAVGDTAASLGYARQGFLPQAVVNFLALLGWSSKSDEEVFTLFQLVERFSLEAVNRSPARFDGEKCAWLNQQYIRLLSPDEFALQAKDFVDLGYFGLSDPKHSNYVGKWDFFKSICRLVQPRVRLFTEVERELLNFTPFEQAVDISVPTGTHQMVMGLQHFHSTLGTILDTDDFSPIQAKQLILNEVKNLNLKPVQLMLPVRLALTGKSQGPDLGEILSAFGPSLSAKHINDFMANHYKEFLISRVQEDTPVDYDLHDL